MENPRSEALCNSLQSGTVRRPRVGRAGARQRAANRPCGREREWASTGSRACCPGSRGLV